MGKPLPSSISEKNRKPTAESPAIFRTKRAADWKSRAGAQGMQALADSMGLLLVVRGRYMGWEALQPLIHSNAAVTNCAIDLHEGRPIAAVAGTLAPEG